jgi:hypothetical protein
MYAYYCLHRLNWEPSRFANLPQREKALVIEMINEMIKNEKSIHRK